MRRSLCVLLATGLVFFLTACPTSIEPFYTPEDVQFDPALLGVWADEDGGSVWDFSRHTDGSYRVLMLQRDEKPGEFRGTLFKIDDKLFLDLFPDRLRGFYEGEAYQSNYQFHFVPVHSLLHVQLAGDTLNLIAPSLDWVSKHLKATPDALAHKEIEGYGLVLTAPTKDLQAFFIKHLQTEEAFAPPEKLSRKRKWTVKNDHFLSNYPGTYTSKKRRGYFLDLRKDGSFIGKEAGKEMTGKYHVIGRRLIFRADGRAAVLAELREDGSIHESDGIHWKPAIKEDYPKLSREEREAIIAGANSTFHNYRERDKEPEEQGVIPRSFWAQAIKGLGPLRVRDDMVNIFVVLKEEAESEEGYYVTLPISSYAPGGEGRFLEFEKLTREGDKAFGELYRAKIKKPLPKAQGSGQ